MAIKFDFKGQTALVTGGTSGLGATIAEALALAGADVCVTGRDESRGRKAESALAKSGGRSFFVASDVRNSQEVAASVRQTVERFGKIDILVNSAGVFRTCPALEMSDEEWDDMMAVNLRGTFLYCREVGKEMEKAGRGKIVNLASTDSFVAVDGELGYCVSKAGVVQLTKVLGVEWIKKGIHVNAVAPCDFETPLIAPYMARPEYRDWTLNAIPIGRVGQPKELVSAVLYLCSPDSSMVVGHTLVIDGGRTII